jgi:hypothetical protein
MGAGTRDIHRICGQQVFLLSIISCSTFPTNVTQGSSPHSTTYANMLIQNVCDYQPRYACECINIYYGHWHIIRETTLSESGDSCPPGTALPDICQFCLAPMTSLSSAPSISFHLSFPHASWSCEVEPDQAPPIYVPLGLYFTIALPSPLRTSICSLNSPCPQRNGTIRTYASAHARTRFRGEMYSYPPSSVGSLIGAKMECVVGCGDKRVLSLLGRVGGVGEIECRHRRKIESAFRTCPIGEHGYLCGYDICPLVVFRPSAPLLLLCLLYFSSYISFVRIWTSSENSSSLKYHIRFRETSCDGSEGFSKRPVSRDEVARKFSSRSTV